MYFYEKKNRKLFILLFKYWTLHFNIFIKCFCGEIYESSFVKWENRICFYNVQVIFNEKNATSGVRCILDRITKNKNTSNLHFLWIYSDRNYINFDYLDEIIKDNNLNVNRSGKFLSRFNLLYYLKLTQKIDSFVENLNLKDLYNLLLMLDELKAKQNANLKHFTRALLLRLISGNDFKLSLFLFRNRLKKIWCINFYIANQFLIGFFKLFFVNIILFDKNFIASTRKYENFKFKLKNYLPNNIYFAVLRNQTIIEIERILSKKIYFIFFQFISMKININYLVLKNIDLDDENILRTKFKIFKIESFIIVKLWKVSGHHSHFFSKLSIAMNIRIKFFSCEMFKLTTYEIERILQKNSLIGLEMNYNAVSNTGFQLKNFGDPNDTLRIIDLTNVIIKDEWWFSFCYKSNIEVLIISSFDMFLLSNIINTMHMCLFCKRLQRLELCELSYDLFDRLMTKFHCFESLLSFKIHSKYSILLVDTIFFCFFKNLKNITEIDLIFVNLTIKDIKILFKMKNLEKLYLKSSYLNILNTFEIDLSFFYRNIKCLNFTNTMISDIFFNVIANCESIIYLNLERSKFDHKCFQIFKIFRSCQTIEYLNLSHNDLGTNHDISIFVNFINLKKLKLHSCNLSCGFFSIGSSNKFLRHLEYLDISKNFLGFDDLNTILSLKNLKTLDISNCIFRDFNICSILPIRLIIYSSNDRNYFDQNLTTKDELLCSYHFEELKTTFLDFNRHNEIILKIFNLISSKKLIQNKYFKVVVHNIEIIVDLEKILTKI